MSLSKETQELLILKLLGISNDKKESQESFTPTYFWEKEKDYIIRTVTMTYLGKLKALNDKELLLEDCAWIPETSRWNEFVDGKKPNEMEPYKNDVIVSRGAILDATILTKKIKREVL